jgi:hypothetical protein
MMIDWTGVRDVLITLILGVISLTLVPYLRAKVGEVKWAEIIQWIKVAVNAAEMLYKDRPGEIKKEYAKQVLDAAGIDPNLTQVDAAIEAEVFALKHAPETQVVNVIGNP